MEQQNTGVPQTPPLTRNSKERSPASLVPRVLVGMWRFLASLIDLPFRYIFGRDVFISYSRRDPKEYAPHLALTVQKRYEELHKRKLSFYLDRWLAPASAQLPLSLRLQLRWSSMLVVICTEKAVRSDFVKDEVARYAKHGRKVLPIDVDGAFNAVRSQEPWVSVSGADPETEKGEAVRLGEASENVVERILKMAEFTTQDRRLRTAVWGTLIFVALSVGGTAAFSYFTVRDANAKAAAAARQADSALKRAAAADVLASEAGERARLADEKANAAEGREVEAKERETAAKEAQDIAEDKALDAAQKAAAAEEQRQAAVALGEQARAEAQKQQSIALARRLAAENMPAVDPHLGEPEKKILLSVESMHRFPSAQAYDNLVEGMLLMPRPSQTVSQGGKVAHLTFSPDGKYMATAAGEVLRLTDSAALARGEKLGDARQIPHAGSITKVKFSADGKYLATVTFKGGLRVWQTKSMRELPAFTGQTVEDIAFGDGGLLAVGGAAADPAADSFQPTAYVWKLGETPAVVASARVGSNVNEVSFGEGGKTFTTLTDHEINFWDAATLRQTEPVAKTQNVDGDVWGGRLSPNGKYLAARFSDITLMGRLWTADARRRDVAFIKDLWVMEFSPDGRFLVTSSADPEFDSKSTLLWDASGDGLSEFRFFNYPSIIRAAEFSPDGRFLALANKQGNVQVWDTTRGRVVSYIKPKVDDPEAGGFQFSFSAGGNFLAVATDKDVTLWPVRADWVDSEVEYDGGGRTALSPDGELLAVAGGDSVTLLSVKDGRQISEWKAPCEVEAVAFDWEAARVATAGSECGVWVWPTRGEKAGKQVEPKQEDQFEEGESKIHSLTFSRDGLYLVVADRGARVVALDGARKPVEFPLTGEILSAALSPDGRRFAAAYSDGIYIWDWRTPGAEPRKFEYQMSNADGGNDLSIAFDDDGNLVIAEDYVARIWRVGGDKAEEIGRFKLHDDSRSSSHYPIISSNGAYVGTTLSQTGQKVAHNARTIIRKVQPAAVIANACGRLSRGRLTKGEWTAEFGSEPYQGTCEGRPAASPRAKT